jgi:hypothetical protein
MACIGRAHGEIEGVPPHASSGADPAGWYVVSYETEGASGVADRRLKTEGSSLTHTERM